jgi:hypothetical protein
MVAATESEFVRINAMKVATRIMPPAISASDPAAAHPATRQAVRPFTWNPCRRSRPST